jgi:dUTPase
MKETKEYASTKELYENSTSERGADGFGSTDKK